MASPPRCLPLERSFVLAVAILGATLFIISFNLIQSSHYVSFRRSISERRRRVGAFSEVTLRRINELLTDTTSAPVTDVPWLQERGEPVRPFLPPRPHPFLVDNLISSPDVCRNTSVDLLIVIHSSVKNFHRRRLLRETWAAIDTISGVTVRRIFALGTDKSRPLHQILVNTEQANFGDILQGDFEDSYGNATRQAVNTLRWINAYCLHARFILKTDDDIFVNVFRLVEHHLQLLSGQRHTAMCLKNPENSSVIIRSPKSKWYVPKTLLASRTHWPVFCSGFVVIMTPDNVPALYGASFSVPYVPVDDGYVYGMLPQAAANYSLRYVDISEDLEVGNGRLLTRYQKSSSMQLAGAALSETTFLHLWRLTVARLSPWAQVHANITRLFVNVSAQFL